MVNSINQPKQLSTTRKKVNYAKWGYIFILPFFVIYAIFSLWPLLQTFYYSFFQYYRKGLEWVGPNFVGIANYQTVLMRDDFFKYLGNTLILWVLCFVPQIVVSLLLAVWFTDRRLKLKGQRAFKTIIYMPNLIMATAVGFLFLSLFGNAGPINYMLQDMGILSKPFSFVNDVWATRIIIAFMNFLMWFGNTTILLMAGIQGIDESLFESARLDGSTSTQVFFNITMPLLMPIFVYVFITSMIGGIQMFDVPQVLTNGHGIPDNTSTTLIMYLNNFLGISKNYGMAGAVSVLLFIITAVLSTIVFKSIVPSNK
jgi:multiple sugar transport system permease protein